MKYTSELKEFMNTTFPGLVIKPSLFNQWNSGIHFEFGKGLYQLKEESDELNPAYFQTVYYQAASLFNEIFSDIDEIFVVTNVYHYKDAKRRSRKLKVYSHHIKNKDIRFHLKQETLPYMFEDEEEAEAEEMCTTQFSLKCRKQDIRYHALIKAICNQDFPSLKPRLHHPNGDYPNVFFINVTKNVILFIYDDRGCEVIASDDGQIRKLYDKYAEWVEECCREEKESRMD
ncbi:DUF3885 domain-containing protein [Sutcliffiella rhizosphaerae]|uniref:DUF3885 domain-containing protein n=1 Tax=Sutcliffiella rhizosphaerae TaxID=2880967 RepID=A0ABM8YTP1_9BACI|nr:DUF3885 domain-containing protein [Sutcliffiella rhizosphaerae]CAG9623339.1 hypothetical protein BACCIP111883_04140 [Sutcliffiella rhizosphaerae]